MCVAGRADRLSGDWRLASGAATAADDLFALVQGRPVVVPPLGLALSPTLGPVAR